MKKIVSISCSLFLVFALSLQAAVKSTDEMSQMSVSQLQAYLSTLSQEDFNQAIVNIVATNNALFIRKAIVAAQNVINSKSAEQRQPAMNSLLAACPVLAGVMSVRGKAMLSLSTNSLKTNKIGTETPTASKAANEQ